MKSRENKENIKSPIEKFPKLVIDKPNATKKSPLGNRYDLSNSKQASPAHLLSSKYNMIESQSSNPDFFSNLKKSDFSASIMHQFRVMHITSVHSLINSAREKKSQIEDLLREEESKAEYLDLNEVDGEMNRRKLKKVVRLLEIVCKIILGKSDHNSYLDMNLNLQASLKEMHLQSAENYEYEIKTKNCEISRLKKLVELLTCSSSLHVGKDYNESQLSKSSFIEAPIFEAEIQTERVTLEEEIFERAKELLESMKMIKSSKLAIHHEFSLWNILDGSEKKNKEQIERNSDYQSQRSMSLYENPLMNMEGKSTFLKRYKSIVKICLNSLNLCSNLIMRKSKGAPDKTSFDKKIIEISNRFNEEYHKNPLEWKEGFCKEIRNEIGELYEEVLQIFKKTLKADKLEPASSDI